jgi:hypothetical protein
MIRDYPRMTAEQAARFMALVMPEPNTGCWLWLGNRTNGYGRYRPDGNGGSTYRAHRLAYVYFVGPVDPALTLDHVRSRGCGLRCCVNPGHLEPVTNWENVRRGASPVATNDRATTCKRGHCNFIVREQTGWRTRRTCKDMTDAARRRRLSQERKERRLDQG